MDKFIVRIFWIIMDILWCSVLVIGLIAMIDGFGALNQIDGVIMVSVWIIVQTWSILLNTKNK